MASGVERASNDRWRVPTPPRTLPDGHPLLRETNTINTPDRVAFRRDLVDRVIGDARPPTDGPPRLDVMGGGGASGKGAVLDYLVLDGRVSTDNAVRLDPDGVKELIPEFGEVVRAGDSRAADVVHEESSQVAKSVLSEAMDRRLNIVYDVTLGNPDKSTRVLQDAKDRGYEVNLWGVTADPEVAVERAASRAEHSGRYVPVDRQLEAHRGFSAGFERYAAIVDKARLFDTNGPEPRLIARARAGEIRVIDEDAYDAFQTKAAIDPEAGGPSELYGRRSAP
jgi:predicted ABC-type ATPase